MILNVRKRSESVQKRFRSNVQSERFRTFGTVQTEIARNGCERSEPFKSVRSERSQTFNSVHSERSICARSERIPNAFRTKSANGFRTLSERSPNISFSECGGQVEADWNQSLQYYWHTQAASSRTPRRLSTKLRQVSGDLYGS